MFQRRKREQDRDSKGRGTAKGRLRQVTDKDRIRIETREVRKAITAAHQKFLEAVRQGDWTEFVAATYTRDAKLLPPNSDFIEGTQAMQAFWQDAMNMGIKDATPETVELEVHGDSAIEVGKYDLLDDGGQILDTGKYVVIWKPEDGQWKRYRDIWNSSTPASAP